MGPSITSFHYGGCYHASMNIKTLPHDTQSLQKMLLSQQKLNEQLQTQLKTQNATILALNQTVQQLQVRLEQLFRQMYG